MSATSPPPASSSLLAGQLVVLTGKLASLGHKEARALVERLGGSTADDVSVRTTMLVMGALGEEGVAGDDSERAGDGHDSSSQTRGKSLKLKRAEDLNAQQTASIQILSEDAFCRLVGVPAPTELRQQYHGVRDVLGRYRSIREDHLRYLIKCGVVRPVLRNNADTYFTFQDLAVIKQANDELAQGASFRSVVKSLLAAREGQLSFDFRLDAEPARIITLERRRSHVTVPSRPQPTPTTAQRAQMAEEFFRAASTLDDGDASTVVEAAAKYRKALELDPCLVAALINLANIHYSRDELIEAQALYEQAIGIEPDYFEAHFNLGNIHHDLGRFPEAQACYREALRLNPTYADAHFYLAVTFEKMGLSHEAKPHWTAYRQLAPKGEWVELAKEFSD